MQQPQKRSSDTSRPGHQHRVYASTERQISLAVSQKPLHTMHTTSTTLDHHYRHSSVPRDPLQWERLGTKPGNGVPKIILTGGTAFTI